MRKGDSVNAGDEELLQASTGWTGPVSVVVTNNVSGRTQEHTLERPFAIVGRAEQADISISKGGVAFRHAYLQMIRGHLLCVDCGADSGVIWEEGRKRADWLTPGRIVRVGDCTLQLASNGASPGEIPTGFNPLKTYKDELGSLPNFEIEFLNAQIKSLVVPLIHMLTIVGRHRSCKFHFDDESVSHAHASFLRTPEGLWLIDLLGRDGTLVKGEPVRCCLLNDGDDLKIGLYRMKVRIAHEPEASALTEDDHRDRADAVTTSTILVSSNKVFVVEQAGSSIIVTPEGAPKQFRYADVHHEANRVLNLLNDPEIKSLIVDLSREEIFTSVAIGVFNRLRNAISVRGGRAALCCASEQMESVLKEMGLYGLWQHFPTRKEAVAGFNS